MFDISPGHPLSLKTLISIYQGRQLLDVVLVFIILLKDDRNLTLNRLCPISYVCLKIATWLAEVGTDEGHLRHLVYIERNTYHLSLHM